MPFLNLSLSECSLYTVFFVVVYWLIVGKGQGGREGWNPYIYRGKMTQRYREKTAIYKPRGEAWNKFFPHRPQKGTICWHLYHGLTNKYFFFLYDSWLNCAYLCKGRLWSVTLSVLILVPFTDLMPVLDLYLISFVILDIFII